MIHFVFTTHESKSVPRILVIKCYRQREQHTLKPKLDPPTASKVLIVGGVVEPMKLFITTRNSGRYNIHVYVE